MSTYSPSLRIQLINTGDQAGTWGNTTNTNLGTLVESAVAGYISVSITSANQALTALDGAADQSRNAVIALTTTTTAAFNVYAPPAEKTYVIYNASAYTATVYNSTVLGNTTAAGSGAIIPAGRTATIWSDGTNFFFQNDHLSALTLATDLAVADGGTGASNAADARTNLGLGSIATQAANNVAITGGSISGITDLAVADGGTGASTAANARTNLGLAIGVDIPSLLGVGASGTWNINVTGNAATATNATSAGNANTVTNGVYTTDFSGSNQSLGVSGYQRFPGGLIVQWGSFTAPADDSRTITLPITFPNLGVFVTHSHGMGNNAKVPRANFASNGAINTFCDSFGPQNTTGPHYWVAIGY